MRINLNALNRQIKLEQNRQDNHRDVQGSGRYEFTLPEEPEARTEALELIERFTTLLDSLPPIPRIGRGHRHIKPDYSDPSRYPLDDRINDVLPDILSRTSPSRKPKEDNWPFENRS